MENILCAAVLSSLPSVDEVSVDAALRRELSADPTRFIVLDDDPTGTQTVHGVTVFTDWSVDSLRAGLLEKNKLFFVLTNSRGLTEAETADVHRQIAANAASAARETGVPYLFISRSDSTLRGHYPLETELLRRGLEADGRPVDGEILCFFFREGGRFTLNNIHYVRNGEELVPAAQTEFARDATFGYSHSDLPGYIEEKTDGVYPASGVTCISLDELRRCDYAGIQAKLERVNDFGKVVVNAADYCDVKVFAVALFRSMASGKRFLFRSAAGLVKVLGGIGDRPLLRRSEMIRRVPDRGGVVVVGSHTAKTTAQLENLLTLPDTVPIPFRSSLVLQGDEALTAEVDRCVALEKAAVRVGQTAVCFTERVLLALPGDTKETALLRSVKISSAVQQLVGRLDTEPSFVIAKGGITSSTIGTDALRVKRATVLGQICPGVTVWQTDSGSKFPGIPYVIFPGNVGDAETLRRAVEILTGRD